jgi:hypothetical protein
LRQRHARRGRQLATQLAAQGEAFLAIEALGALVIFDQPFGFEDVVKDRRPPARLERGPVAQPRAQSRVIASRRGVLKAGTVPAGEAADTALRKPKANSDLLHGRSARFGL